MSNYICIGIIGNYFGHLSGAENVEEHPLPNGIFVIHREHEETLTTGLEAKYPQAGTNVDIEPEFVIRFNVSYEDGKVSALQARQMTIGNDYTIRKLDGSDKISQRKAWGEKSKGINRIWWDMKEFTPENYGESLKLVSYIEREGEFFCATPLVDCTQTKVFHSELEEWIIDRINNQEAEGMYEEILPSLAKQGYPQELILYTGAPNYSQWGEDNFVLRGDKVHIAAYHSEKWSDEQVQRLFKDNHKVNNDEIMCFSQEVI
ncbi:DUF5718 family protein [Vibrio sp. JC009]|uniref:DUF5718 family protein n=1 Tax=Vibrio sp. JC009 TaxID=2912314 RepID=UPI0023B02A5D|nr:DUF5718 family protein [Vibrio sp. JC009]WED23960.1 DUF5718 family protein [Vibrio sp. JC009]